jgi:Leucine-rich repeat (LRR) protein
VILLFYSTVTASASQDFFVWLNFLAVDHGLAKQLPRELRLLTHLQILNLNGNTLTGVLPTQLGRLSNLVQLDIGNNLISGTIPTELGMITSLEEIITRNNQLRGSIPSQLSNIPSLHAFWADRNDISGDLTTLCEKNKALIASTDCDQVICPCCSICCYNNAECAFSSSFNK